MKKIARKLLIGIYVFLLCLGIPKQSLVTQALEEQVTVYDFVANEASGDFLQQFAQIGNFNEYGIAIVSLENGLDINNNPSFLYGLINLEGALVLPVEYSSIRDFDDDYYMVFGDSDPYTPFRNGLVSKKSGAVVMEPKYLGFDYVRDGQVFAIEYSPTNSFNNRRSELWYYQNGIFHQFMFEGEFGGFTNYSIREYLGDDFLLISAMSGSQSAGDFKTIEFLSTPTGELLIGNNHLVRLESYVELLGGYWIISPDVNDQNKNSLLYVDNRGEIAVLLEQKQSIEIDRQNQKVYFDDGWLDMSNQLISSDVLFDKDGPLNIVNLGDYFDLQKDGLSVLPDSMQTTGIQYYPALNWYRIDVQSVITNMDNSNETISKTLSGVYSVNESMLIYEPIYLNMDYTLKTLSNKGWGILNKSTGLFDYTFGTNKTFIEKRGLIDDRGMFILQPIYDFVDMPNQDGLVQFGYGDYSDGIINYIDRGIYDTKQSKLLALPEYDMFQPFYRTMFYTSTPLFDVNGHIRITKSVPDTGILEGILGKDGILYPVEYEKAYFEEGYYYLKKTNGEWLIENIDKTYSQTLSTTLIQLDEGFTFTGISKYDGIYVVEVSGNDVIKENRYGVLNEDMSVQLDFEFQSIVVDGNILTLERYNEVSLKTEVAVYDIKTQTYVVPFGNKYESMSEYVGGVAIGQSGTAEAPVTTFMFGLNVNAADDEFVLDILNEDGFVVGDLSDKYSETLLLGQNKEGITQAMVKKDSQYYLASLQTTQVPLKAIESVTLLQSNLNLKAGEVTQLNGIIKPLDANEPIKVIWESSDTSIVAVDGKGQIKALKDGSAIVVFKVNEHVASVSIKVGETIVPPVTPPSPPITPSNPIQNPNQGPIVMPQAPNPPVLNIIQPLFALLNQKNVRFAQFEATLKKTYENNPDFLDNLSEAELDRFEEMVYEFYNEKLNIEIDDGFEIEHVLDLIDFGSLIENKPFSLGLHVSEDIDESDKSLVNEFMMSNQLSGDKVLFLNIEFLINDVLQTELSNPVTIRMNIPDALKDVKDLKVLRVHNGVVSVLNVTYLDDGQISFETDRFSMYALVKSTPVSIPVTTSDVVVSNSNDFPWLLIMFVILVVIVSGVLFVYRKRVQI